MCSTSMIALSPVSPIFSKHNWGDWGRGYHYDMLYYTVAILCVLDSVVYTKVSNSLFAAFYRRSSSVVCLRKRNLSICTCILYMIVQIL